MSKDTDTLPPPPHIARFDKDGKPSSAQVEYDLRLHGNINRVNSSTASAIETVREDLQSQITSVDSDLQDARSDFLDIAEIVTNIQSETESSSAAIIQLQGAFADEQTAVAGEITLINARVDDTEASIYQESLVRVSGDTALGSRIDNLILTTGNNAAVIIDSEAQARISADDALGVRIDNVIVDVDGVIASVGTEATSRITGDKAVASKVTTASVGASRVYTQDDAPSSFGRLVGDVWYDTNDDYKPYYWTGSAWADNSLGTYKIGQIAVISNDITALRDSDKSLVRSVTRGIASLSRVYTQDDAPSGERQAGDVWYDTNDEFKQYIWAQVNNTGDYGWRDNSSGTYKIGALATFSSSLSAVVQTVGDGTQGLVKDVTDLGTIVGDVDSGLVHDVSVLSTTVGDSETGIVKDLTSLQTTVGNSSAGIVHDLQAIVTKVGDNQSGLVKDVSELRTTVGDSSAGLVRDVTVLNDKVGDSTIGLVRDVTELNTVAKKKRVYYQDNQPTTVGENPFINGDIWIDSSDGNKQRVWNGSSWTLAYDQRIDDINSIYRQEAEPEGSVVGDIWFDTANNNTPYYWDGTQWQISGDPRLDEITRTYYQDDEPTGDRIVGDLWFDTNDGNKVKYWDGNIWQNASDNRFATLAERASAQRVFAQANQPPSGENDGRIVGDLWLKTDKGYETWVWDGGEWTNASDARFDDIVDSRTDSSRIFIQDDPPPLESAILGDMWLESDNGYKPYFYNEVSWVDWTETLFSNLATTSQLSDERTTWQNADKALAQAITLATAGTNRVYVTATEPEPVNRLKGDVWYNAAIPENELFPVFTPYVWAQINDTGSFAWRNNSNGAYSKYIGSTGSIYETITSTKNKVDNTLGVQWAIQAHVGETQGGLVFTGIKTADGSGYGPENTSYNLKITSNVEIDGNLIVGTAESNTKGSNGVTPVMKIDFDNGTITISD